MKSSKSYIPYDTSGEAPGGSGVIGVCVYGKDEQQARERFKGACNEARLLGNEETHQEPNRVVIKWRERMTGLCDVIEFSGWGKKKKMNDRYR